MLDEAVAAEARGSARLAAVGGNRVLAALPAADLDRVLGQLRTERLPLGHALFEPGDALSEVVFPGAGTTLSLQSVPAGRRRPVETASVGCEGMTGALQGPESGPAAGRCVVLTGGVVLRMPSDAFAQAAEASPALRIMASRYAAALLAQLQQGVACAALHAVEERAGRWLLATQDRLSGEATLPVTQEALSDLLGVRRTTVTRVVTSLEARGLIRHRRGRLTVVDRVGLERTACECHRRIRDHFERVSPGLYPAPAGARTAPEQVPAALGPDTTRRMRNKA